MMFFAHICAYYFAVGIRYFGYLKKNSASFFSATLVFKVCFLWSNPPLSLIS